MKKKILTKLNIIRTALLIGATVIIMLLLPHADRQAYNYELNQPWKYPLLTAEFDMPIMRDSTTARMMRDSIDASFIPFVNRDASIQKTAVTHFGNAMRSLGQRPETHALTALLQEVYMRGIMDAGTYEKVRSLAPRRVRLSSNDDGSYSIQTIDASRMLSPAKAFAYIDSAYSARIGGVRQPLNSEVARALNVCITPNIKIDSVADAKFRNQEYLAVNGAQGIIKKGQRIVDRGEIINPQILANLNTYTEMLEKRSGTDGTHSYFYIGQCLYILSCFCLLYIFLSSFRFRFFRDIRKMTFLMSFITLFVVFAILMSEYFTSGIYMVPFAAVPVIILIFFDSRTAIFALIVTILLSAMVAIMQYQFIFIQLLVGVVAALSINQLSRRAQLLRVAISSFFSYCLLYITVTLLLDGNLEQLTWRMVGIFAINAVTLSFAYIFIFIIEKIFGFSSTVTLVELSDINNPLLRRLAEEAPGTFQHSMQVSTLASEAARAVGANTQLVRTGALYHDVGKLVSPIFFTENQHGVNPHTGLDPEVSAQKIISHVTAGQTIAAQEKLPSVIREFISEHHGRGLVKYFYNTAVNQYGEDKVDKSLFTYPGPSPRSKETAILMMADAVEAASRSLQDYSTEAINTLVDRIVDGQIAEGHFKDSPISFRDVETVKNTFKRRLATIYHSRIAYPEIRK